MDELLPRVALALGIGLLIGLERGWRTREEQPGRRAAGIRTFAISGLLGVIAGAIAEAAGGVAGAGGGIVLAACFAAYSAVITVFCHEENRAEGTFSATTAIAGMLTFAPEGRIEGGPRGSSGHLTLNRSTVTTPRSTFSPRSGGAWAIPIMPAPAASSG